MMNTEFTNWDMRFLDLAKHIASWSKDLSTGVGAVIVDREHRIISIGYNGFCTGCNDNIKERYERKDNLKYLWTEHAERNAIYNASRIGVSTKGCAIYSTLFPCADCCRAIIQTGIVEVVTKKPDLEHHKYGDSFKVSLEMFAEVGVNVKFI